MNKEVHINKCGVCGNVIPAGLNTTRICYDCLTRPRK
jgi:hypothetical protein